MRLDKYSNPVFNEVDLFDALYNGQILSAHMFVDTSDNIVSLEKTSDLKFWKPLDEYDIPLDEYDSAMQANWNMPAEYKSMDIEQWILTQTPPWEPNHSRVTEELAEYKTRNMLDLLRWLKYFVDTCDKNNIVWGVGRGSSVASYVLYLLGVHSIDSIKYNLDWQEFLR